MRWLLESGWVNLEVHPGFRGLAPAARLEKPVWICEAKILIRVAAAQHAKPETPKPESDDPR